MKMILHYYIFLQHHQQIHKIAKIADDFYVPLKGYASDP
jgi:hypothetical protein